MSQRFYRCPHCGMPHDAIQAFCPSTGKSIGGLPSRTKGAWAKRNGVPSPSASAQAPRFVPARSPPWPPPQRELVGKIIGGKYALSAVLGGGGMGTIYEAQHVTIGRPVAIKVLHPAHACKREAVQRFYREARAAGCIRHPNVCEVYDLDSLSDGRPYLVMEKLVGETLASRIASDGRLPLCDLVQTLVQVLSALIATHGKGIVHRDIKPENVFLAGHAGYPPLAKLLDFGVSRTTAATGGTQDDDVDLTRRGMVIGTPHYLSPEQARGDRDLDARVDLYACGVVLYEALTGHRPFVAANQAALLREILDARPRPARELRRALPSAFDPILAKAMAFDREDRYATAAEFRRDLRALGDVRPSASTSESDPDGDDQPTRVWHEPLPRRDVAEAGSTRELVAPPRGDSTDDLITVVQRHVPESLLRAARRPPDSEARMEKG
jgi:serine/threonine-protein kinase